jgi:hypothetical protein
LAGFFLVQGNEKLKTISLEKFLVRESLKKIKIIMARYCSFKNCKSKSDDAVSIFKIPKNSKSQQEWRQFIAKSGKINVDKIVELRLCEFHFSKDDLNHQYNPPRLRAEAVPVFANKKVKKIN